MHSNIYDNNVIHKDIEITKMNSAENDDGMFLISVMCNINLSSCLYDWYILNIIFFNL